MKKKKSSSPWWSGKVIKWFMSYGAARAIENKSLLTWYLPVHCCLEEIREDDKCWNIWLEEKQIWFVENCAWRSRLPRFHSFGTLLLRKKVHFLWLTIIHYEALDWREEKTLISAFKLVLISLKKINIWFDEHYLICALDFF